MSMRTATAMALASLFCLAAHDAGATSIATADAGTVATFVAGATGPIGFDGVPGNSFVSGAPVAAENAVDDALDGLGILFSSTGGPAVAVARSVDARSDPNLLAGTSLSGDTVVVDYLQPVELEFVEPETTTPSTTNLVGAWLDPTGSTVQLEVFDADGESIEMVQANQGLFIGIAAPGIARATFTFLQTGSVPGFSLDDLFVGGLLNTTTTQPPTTTTTSSPAATSTSLTPTTRTSTTRTTRTTTTSTTLQPPPGCAGVPTGPTFRSLDCRLAALIARIQGASDIARPQPLVDQATKAKQRKDQAEALCRSADVKQAQKRLKQMTRTMIQLGHRLRSNTGKRAIPAALRGELIASGDGIRADAKALKRTLLCPSDAPLSR